MKTITSSKQESYLGDPPPSLREYDLEKPLDDKEIDQAKTILREIYHPLKDLKFYNLFAWTFQFSKMK